MRENKKLRVQPASDIPWYLKDLAGELKDVSEEEEEDLPPSSYDHNEPLIFYEHRSENDKTRTCEQAYVLSGGSFVQDKSTCLSIRREEDSKFYSNELRAAFLLVFCGLCLFVYNFTYANPSRKNIHDQKKDQAFSTNGCWWIVNRLNWYLKVHYHSSFDRLTLIYRKMTERILSNVWMLSKRKKKKKKRNKKNKRQKEIIKKVEASRSAKLESSSRNISTSSFGVRPLELASQNSPASAQHTQTIKQEEDDSSVEVLEDNIWSENSNETSTALAIQVSYETPSKPNLLAEGTLDANRPLMTPITLSPYYSIINIKEELIRTGLSEEKALEKASDFVIQSTLNDQKYQRKLCLESCKAEYRESNLDRRHNEAMENASTIHEDIIRKEIEVEKERLMDIIFSTMFHSGLTKTMLVTSGIRFLGHIVTLSKHQVFSNMLAKVCRCSPTVFNMPTSYFSSLSLYIQPYLPNINVLTCEFICVARFLSYGSAYVICHKTMDLCHVGHFGKYLNLVIFSYIAACFFNVFDILIPNLVCNWSLVLFFTVKGRRIWDDSRQPKVEAYEIRLIGRYIARSSVLISVLIGFIIQSYKLDDERT